MILAGIDIGTNTLRLLVAETGPDSFHEIHADRRITRLGQDLDRTGRLCREAEERTLDALGDFTMQLRRYAPRRSAAIGTSALRNAANAPEFIHEVKQRTGLDINVISGREEARLTLLGVAQALSGAEVWEKNHPLKSALVIDIGGGSTELITTRSGAEPVMVSLPLGAVYLTERFIRHDPPSADERDLLRRAVENELDGLAGTFSPAPASRLVGTAGTITTLAAIDQGLAAYDPVKINGSVLSRDFIDEIVHRLGALRLEERSAIRGLEQGREDIIFAGAVVAQELMKRFGYTSMLVSEWGLREGIVLDLYEKVLTRDGAKTPER